ncbi:EAL domain-containing protein [Aliiroseovarius subalbicans]|uniref:EAL domain-containing protein n=1 Tax=Aliiroseovarius subalbicans TaxID=2925840 RepID=UPI001F5AD395|nr:EAL domain-containing protein [Aliiroseovarius subalbicans]MCI2399549.1 EAL domain-containing protein [Aliiroseovarius subalbicans]
MSNHSMMDTADLDAQTGSPLDHAISQRDRDTMDMVHAAVASKQVMLAFQPVVQAARPDQIAFHEGLIRVLDDTGRIIPAQQFIDVVETQELGRIIDTLALEKGLEALAEEPGLRLSINLSARSIGYPRWNEVMKRGLQNDPTLAERLILEITERTAIVMPDLVQVFMADLQQRGVAFALDDFGAGYTAFRYLKDFYFDIMKIDGEFIKGIHASPDNQILTQALLSVARHFDMFTVAESVETLEDAEFLASVGVDCMQGYFFGVPTVNPAWRSDNRQAHTA